MNDHLHNADLSSLLLPHSVLQGNQARGDVVRTELLDAVVAALPLSLTKSNVPAAGGILAVSPQFRYSLLRSNVQKFNQVLPVNRSGFVGPHIVDTIGFAQVDEAETSTHLSDVKHYAPHTVAEHQLVFCFQKGVIGGDALDYMLQVARAYCGSTMPINKCACLVFGPYPTTRRLHPNRYLKLRFLSDAMQFEKVEKLDVEMVETGCHSNGAPLDASPVIIKFAGFDEPVDSINLHTATGWRGLDFNDLLYFESQFHEIRINGLGPHITHVGVSLAADFYACNSFSTSTVERVVIGDLPNVIAVEDNFCIDTGVKELDLRGLPKLARIGFNFCSNTYALRALHMPTSSSSNENSWMLQEVSDSFCGGSAIEAIDLSGWGNVDTIGCSFLASTGIPRIDLSPLRKLETVGAGFLVECRFLTHVSLAGLTSLREVSRESFFNCAALEVFTLGEEPLPNLVEISDDVCTSCPALRLVDITAGVSLHTIGDCFCTQFERSNRQSPAATVLRMGSMPQLERIGRHFGKGMFAAEASSHPNEPSGKNESWIGALPKLRDVGPGCSVPALTKLVLVN